MTEKYKRPKPRSSNIEDIKESVKSIISDEVWNMYDMKFKGHNLVINKPKEIVIPLRYRGQTLMVTRDSVYEHLFIRYADIGGIKNLYLELDEPEIKKES